ncbi:MAG: sodium/proton-translocating pyrophosphatase, partial [Candidatus Omnitrophica bacterium]|nr:sodium/proton-translocating pyrophosphatase [Candidatus Omnitrophota bacterium]
MLLLAPIGSLIAILFAVFLIWKIMRYDEGSIEMKKIADCVREGAYAYIKRQYMVVGLFFAIVFSILFILYLRGYLIIFVPFAFLTGGFFSGLCGFIGMSVSTRSGSRTANAAKSSLNRALQVAFSSGAVMGLMVVGLGLLDLSIWYYFLDWYYRGLDEAVRIQNITSTMLNFGMGAS